MGALKRAGRLALRAALFWLGAVSAAAAAEMDLETAERFSRLALACADRQFPNKPEHVLDSAADLRLPQELHPAFFGCYDWHSSVHGHWMLVRLLRLHPGLPSGDRIRSLLDSHLTVDAVSAEKRYLEASSARTFERPYGWAWTLRLAEELSEWDDPQARVWRERLRPLEGAVVARIQDYLPKLTRPVRSGIHPNTAFALALAIDYARRTERTGLERVLASRSHFYFDADRACPLAYEPSGEDFFSPCLAEADLMRRIVSPKAYGKWLQAFLPNLSARRKLPLLPVSVTDPTDPRLVHFDGLNLSRAWMLRGIASGLPPADSRRPILETAAEAHAKAGLARVSSGDYAGEHWLATFAVYLETEAGRGGSKPAP